MIFYGQTVLQIVRARIKQIAPTWTVRAAMETKTLIGAGYFTPLKGKASTASKSKKPPPSLWAEIKLAFMEVQHFKCIYCERALAASDGKIEHDVEHFRPKNPVVPWIAPSGLPNLKHRNGPAAKTGYYWLAYDLENYAAACKSCNSIRKRSFFPILGTRGAATQDVASLNLQEQPGLIFPLSEDPEELIAFNGLMAQPTFSAGQKYERAICTITMFNLNGRPELWEDRIRTISAVFHAVEVRETSEIQAKRDDAKETIAELTRNGAPQAACARSFLKLMHTDPGTAWTIYRDARDFIKKQQR